MTRLSPLFLTALIATAATSARAGAIIEGDPNDGGVLSNSVNSGYYDIWRTQGVGQLNRTDVGNVVEPFALPYLAPGQTITNATISFFLISETSPNTNVQLYGLTRVSATSPTVTTADWYQGTGDASNTLLTSDFATPSTAVNSTVTYSGSNLVSFIQKQYANSAFSGADLSSTRYIFFRLSPEAAAASPANYQFITARNPNRALHPALALTISGGISNMNGRLQFAFNLPQNSITSAGVYNPSTGALLRTLWNHKPFGAGTNYGAWDGKDDNGKALPTGTSYQIKLIYHNVQYVFDGMVGNTSANQSGISVYKSLYPLMDMSIAGGTAYYAAGYNEEQDPFHCFQVGAPQVSVQVKYNYTDVASAINYVAADATHSYWAKCAGGIGGNNTYVVALNNSDGSNYTFPSGTTPTGANQMYTSCVDFDATANQPNPPSGVAVQQSGSELFVSHSNLNIVRVYDKIQGTQLGTLNITAPSRVAVTANGDVWIVSSATPPVVSRYTFTNGKAKLVRSITGLTQPVGVGVSADDSVVVIADSGTSQQLKAFNNTTGAAAWTFGQAGGMPALGPAINPSTFDFQGGTFIAFQSDNTFWTYDTGNNRALHYSISGSTLNYIEQLSWLNESYRGCVDLTDPTRVFNTFWEFAVNYSLPLGGTNGSWSMQRNWFYGLPNDSTHSYLGFCNGLRNVVTLPNGHTYALIKNFATSRSDLFELPATGPARLTGYSFDDTPRIYADGTLRMNIETATSLSYYSAPLSGFDSSNNPKWSTPALLASTPLAATDPQLWTTYPERTEVSTTGIVFTYDPYQGRTGNHLGGIAVGGSAWKWQSAPSTTSTYTGFFPQDGHFDIGNGVQYAGDESMGMGRSLICGYHGEFWKDGQASQWLHYYDNGLMVGIFGSYSADMKDQVTVDGYSGNAFSPDLVRTADGNVYLYTNDESNHGGSVRWHIEGLDGITEITGTSTLGSTVSLAGSGAPTVAITSPTPNAIFNNSPSISVSADAAGAGAAVTSVQFFDGTTSLGTATTAPYTITTGALTPGAHSVTATATDANGLSATSPAISFVVGNESGTTPPAAPASLTVAATTPATVSLAWSQPAVGTSTSTTGQVISFQCDTATNNNALLPATVAGAPGYAVANFNVINVQKSGGLIFINPLNSAGTTIANFGLSINVDGGNPGGSISGLPGSAQQLFSNDVWTSFSTYPAITLEFIPYAYYDLVVYSLVDSSNPATTFVTVSDGAKSSVVNQTFTKAPTAYNVADVAFGANAAVTDMNTIVFQGLTSATTEIQGNNVAGFQIVERPYDQGVTASYSVERATGTGAFAVLATTPDAITTFTDITAVAGATYQYRVRALNSYGPSGYSNTVSAVPGVTVGSGTGTSPGGSSGGSSGSSGGGSTGSSGGSGGTTGSSGGSGSGSGSGGSTGTPGSGTTPTSGFGAWQAQYFTAAQVADPTISGPSADPYGSGVPNLLAYALQLNPAQARPTDVPRAVLNNGHLALTYVVPASVTDVTFVVEVSGDLNTWNSGPGYTSVTSSVAGATGTTNSVQDTMPGSVQKQFMRLRVSQN